MPTTTGTTNELAARFRFALIPLVRQLRQQNGPDLTASQASALASVLHHGPVTVGELAELERVSSPMITKIAKGLTAQGLLTRTPDTDDRRVTRLDLTERGRVTLEDNRTRKDAWLAQRLADLDPTERAVLEAAIPILEAITEGRERP